MSGLGRGRGRSKGSKPEMKEPDKTAVDKINQERASINKKFTPEQTRIEQTADSKSPLTIIGEGKTPPAIQDVKDALKGGVHVQEPPKESSSEVMNLPHFKQPLNPSVEPFVPTVPSLNTRLANTKGTTPMYTKSMDDRNPSLLSQNSSNHFAGLNPESSEFVPLSVLANGDCGNGSVGDDDDEEAIEGWCSIMDIVKGFERAAPTDAADNVMSEEILKRAAETLLKVYNYPGSFDEIGKEFEEFLRSKKPSESILINLAQMLIHWGVKMPEVRYSSCRICHLVSENNTFTKILLKRLQEWHKAAYGALSTDEAKLMLVNYSGFLAEIYAKIDVDGNPVAILGPVIFGCVSKLLDFQGEVFIREACNILKLTGSNLRTVANYSEQIGLIKSKVQDLAGKTSLSETSMHLLMQVLELIGLNWGFAASRMQPTTSLPSLDKKPPAPSAMTKLNSDAPPFVPSTMYSFSETYYGADDVQEPVAQAEEWIEFVGEDDANEYLEPDATNPYYGGYLDGDDDDGLDPEIELEMEAFIDEIEEHLVLQDFDPNLQKDPQ